MRKTYVTKVPDASGVFLMASRIIASHGGNIVRANYNKAVDMHTFFVEVCAEPEEHAAIARDLKAKGFLTDQYDERKILMLALKLPNRPGSVTGPLEVLEKMHISISYVSDHVEPDGSQVLKLGILMEDTGTISKLLEELSQICETHVQDYEVTDRLLDSTVFYITFTNELRKTLSLSPKDANCLLIRSNKMMQVLDEQDKSPLQTFDYIRRFARFVADHHGAAFDAVVSRRELADDLTLHVIEPPCGSNTFVLEHGKELLFVDGGYSCFREEMLRILHSLFPDLEDRRKTGYITHVDMDHTGLVSLWEEIYMSENSRRDLLWEAAGQPGFREQNPNHRPYFTISEIITSYEKPGTDHIVSVGEKKDDALISYIGSRSFAGRKWDIYEGAGGHVKGEIVIVCEELKLLFSGDIFVNVKGITPEQKEFNRLAPFLLTGVDEDPALAKQVRQALVSRFPGYTYCTGHGPVLNVG